jgi:Holliday junction resolvasome RuvABC endonuclease subunit
MIVCGIDPGLTGGITFIHGDEVSAHRTPVVTVKKKKLLNLVRIVDYLQLFEPDIVYIEKQQSMPRQGVASTFKTGLNYGLYLGLFVALDIKYVEVRAAKWKKDLNVSSDKDLARARASYLLPQASSSWELKCEDGVAESALIAYWGLNCGQEP